MKVIIAPYAARLETGQNPKTYSHWAELVSLLNAHGHEVTQIGCHGELRIAGVKHFLLDWPLDRLKWLVNNSDLWVSVDSFFQHLCATEKLKPGIVLWSVSDDRIFGYPHNINLFKNDRAYLRALQFRHWKDEPYNAEAFVTPEEVVRVINERYLVPAAA